MRLPPLVLENAEITFRNFSGKRTRYNNEGNRNFCVFIDDPVILQQLIDEKWNVKYTKPRDEADTPRAFIRVSVAFDRRPPHIFMVNPFDKSLTELDEETVSELDWADILHCDMTINPSHWVGEDGREGVKGYVKSLYAVIDTDPFANKYGA